MYFTNCNMSIYCLWARDVVLDADCRRVIFRLVADLYREYLLCNISTEVIVISYKIQFFDFMRLYHDCLKNVITPCNRVEYSDKLHDMLCGYWPQACDYFQVYERAILPIGTYNVSIKEVLYGYKIIRCPHFISMGLHDIADRYLKLKCEKII